MRKNKVKTWVAILSLLIGSGCVEESSYFDSFQDPNENTTPFTLEDVQEYFDATVTSFYVSPEGPTRNPDEDMLTMPLWDKGEIRQLEDKRIAEVPVMAPITIMSPVSLHNDSVVVTYYTFMNTTYNLIAEKTVDDGFLFTIARITGDPDYLIERKRQKLEGMTITDKEHFCGSIRYFTLKGEFLYGEIFKNGKKTATITKHKHILPGTAEADSILLAYKLRMQRADSLIHFKTRAIEKYCYDVPYWVGDWACYDVFLNEDYIGTHCERSEVEGHWEWEEVCEEYEVPDPPTEPYPDPDPNPGGGGGGGGGGGTSDNDPPPPVAPKAQKIFRNSNMTDANWKTIETLLEKIMKDSMGKALYDALVTALNGKTIIFNFGEGEDSWFNYNDGDGIVLGKMAAESNRLLHEMWHAYQAYQETTTSYENALLNLEIEAHYVQYLYLTGLDEFYEPGNKWQQWYIADPRMRNIANLHRYVDDEGNLRKTVTNNHLQTKLEETIKTFNNDDSYNYYKYDSTREPLETFKNLRKLMNK